MLKRENVEVRDDGLVEGTSDEKQISKIEILVELNELEIEVEENTIEVWFDNYQGFWRFRASLNKG
jgi:hypothetical protein